MACAGGADQLRRGVPAAGVARRAGIITSSQAGRAARQELKLSFQFQLSFQF
jgi:hypothetical protein